MIQENAVKNQKLSTLEKFLENGKFESKFEKLEDLGEGGFGQVFKVRHILDKNIYAIKRVKLHLGMNQKLENHKVLREISAMTCLKHKHIIKYATCWLEMAPLQE